MGNGLWAQNFLIIIINIWNIASDLPIVFTFFEKFIGN